MSGTSWGNGCVEFKRYKDGKHRVVWFENDGVVWYDVAKGIAIDGWENELKPYEGDDVLGWPLNDPPDWLMKQ